MERKLIEILPKHTGRGFRDGDFGDGGVHVVNPAVALGPPNGERQMAEAEPGIAVLLGVASRSAKQLGEKEELLLPARGEVGRENPAQLGIGLDPPIERVDEGPEHVLAQRLVKAGAAARDRPDLGPLILDGETTSIVSRLIGARRLAQMRL